MKIRIRYKGGGCSGHDVEKFIQSFVHPTGASDEASDCTAALGRLVDLLASRKVLDAADVLYVAGFDTSDVISETLTFD